MAAKREVSDPRTGVRIVISSQAASRIGGNRVNQFLKDLRDFMVQVEADWAYVSKSGRNVAVFLRWSAR